MCTKARWKWVTSVFAVTCLTAGHMEMSAFAASREGSPQALLSNETAVTVVPETPSVGIRNAAGTELPVLKPEGIQVAAVLGARQANSTPAAASTPAQTEPAKPTGLPPRKGLRDRLKNWKVLAGIAAVGVAVAAVLMSRKEKVADVTIGAPTIGNPK